MAYNHQMVQRIMSPVTIGTGQGPTLAVGDIGHYAPGLQPEEVRGVAVLVTLTATTTAPVVDFYRRPTAGSDTARVLIKRLNPVLASWVAGNVIYADVEGTTLSPGEDIIAEVSTAPAAGAGICIAMFQADWEHPSNNTRMIKVA